MLIVEDLVGVKSGEIDQQMHAQALCNPLYTYTYIIHDQ